MGFLDTLIGLTQLNGQKRQPQRPQGTTRITGNAPGQSGLSNMQGQPYNPLPAGTQPLGGQQMQMAQNQGFQPNIGFGYEDNPMNGVQDAGLYPGAFDSHAGMFQGGLGPMPQHPTYGTGQRLQGGNNPNQSMLEMFKRLGY